MAKHKTLDEILRSIESFEEEDYDFKERVDPENKGKKKRRKKVNCKKCGSSSWFKGYFDAAGAIIRCSDCPHGRGRH